MGFHLDRVPPVADVRGHLTAGVQTVELAEERARLVFLVEDDLILAAPPDLQRDLGTRDLRRQSQRAAIEIRAGKLARCPADLAAKRRLQELAVRPAERWRQR